MKNVLGRKLSSIPTPDLTTERYTRTVLRRFCRHKLAVAGSIVVLVLVSNCMRQISADLQKQTAEEPAVPS